MTILIFIMVFLANAVVFRWALSGKRIGGHPVCRKCGYDLRERDTQSEHCPECGLRLDVRGAIRMGERRRSAVFVAIGFVLVVASIVVLKMAVSSGSLPFDINTYKPAGWLALNVSSDSAATRDGAIKELILRLRSGSLSVDQINSLTDTALALQADPHHLWDKVWGDFLEAARAAKRLPDEKWKRYAEQMLSYQLRVRPQVRRGEPVPFEIDLLPGRVGSKDSFYFDEKFRVNSDNMGRDDSGWSSYLTDEQMIPDHARRPLKDLIWMDPAKVTRLADGPYQVAGIVKVDIWERSSQTLLSSKEFDLNAPFKLVPADAQTVTAVHNDSLLGAITQSISVKSFDWHSPTSVPAFDGTIWVAGAPADLALKVLARAGNDSWTIGLVMLHKGQSDFVDLHNAPRDFRGDKIDIVLQSDARVARDSVDLTSYWDGPPIVFHDVAVPGSPYSGKGD